MLETLKEWLPLLTGLISAGILAARVKILHDVVGWKDATIQAQRAQIEWLQTQTLEAVHARNKALMEELEAHHEQRKKEIAELELVGKMLAPLPPR